MEYIRSVIPVYTNRKRYVAYVRILNICVIAEFQGDLFDIAASDVALGFSVEGMVDQLFSGTAGHADMLRELRSFLLLTGNKTGKEHRKQKLFDKYVEPWLVAREDGFARESAMAAALACNDLDGVWFDEAQWQVLSELSNVMYDAVAFHKHRAEGEVPSTFAYVPSHLRSQAFHNARELVFALETAWIDSGKEELLVIPNFLRASGGPIHMTTRRYRYVEEGLTMGKVETNEAVQQAGENFKFWNRMGAPAVRDESDKREEEWFQSVLDRRDELLFPGCAEMLLQDDRKCLNCVYSETYGAGSNGEFRGVQLCEACKSDWGRYVLDMPARAAKAFPELGPYLDSQVDGKGLNGIAPAVVG